MSVSLGSTNFLNTYNVKHPYVAGAMYKGIASTDVVIAMAKRQFLSFLGTGGVSLSKVEDDIKTIKSSIPESAPFGMNMLANLEEPEKEMHTIELYLKHDIKVIEAAAFMDVSPALVYYRIKGLVETGAGIECNHRIIAKVSRPEVAKRFASPASSKRLKQLLRDGLITEAEAELASKVPMADDITVEADSGGHTDQGVLSVLFPSIRRLVDELNEKYHFPVPVRVGAAGGLSTPESLAAAFFMGADYVLTGSINQCTVEAAISDEVKDMLQNAKPQDVAIAPAGDMFELGAKIQVLKKGSLFAPRANKLFDLYKRYNAIEELPEDVVETLESQVFGRSIDAVWQETADYYAKSRPNELVKAEESSKHKMALIFKWYFVHTTRAAKRGDSEQRSNYQVQCGPALGAFNALVKGTPFESWRNRHVDEIAEMLMRETKIYIQQRINQFSDAISSEQNITSNLKRI